MTIRLVAIFILSHLWYLFLLLLLLLLLLFYIYELRNWKAESGPGETIQSLKALFHHLYLELVDVFVKTVIQVVDVYVSRLIYKRRQTKE